MTRTLAITLVLLGLCACTAHAAAGDPDPTFDGDGRLVLPYAAAPAAILVQPDGRLVIAGYDEQDFMVWRLEADGTPDRGFGDDGVTRISFGSTHDQLVDAALQPDGKIVVTGSAYGAGADSALAVARLDAGGDLDGTFDPGGADGAGKKLFASADDVRALGVAVQPYDGRIVLSAYSTGDSTFVLTRLDDTGAVDGTVFEDPPTMTGEYLSDVALQPDGSIVVAGEALPNMESASVPIVARYTPQGSLDETLAGTGIKRFAGIRPDDLLIRPDGTLVVAGTAPDPDGGGMAVTQLTARGEVYTAFGTGGTAAAGFDGEDAAAAALLQPDGKVVVVGRDAGANRFLVARVGATGVLDATFAAGGRLALPFGERSQSTAAALQPDGRILVGGATRDGEVVRLALTRLLGSAAPVGDVPGPGPAGKPPVRRCAGRRATIVGTPGRDTLRGTRRADVIVALGGRDRVLARGGNDVVCGGAGDDVLRGGRGRDRLFGGPGRDRTRQ